MVNYILRLLKTILPVLFVLFGISLGAQVINKKTAPAPLKKLLFKSDQWLNQKQYVNAIKGYDKIIKKYPNYIDAWINKGSALYEQGNWEEAIKNYKQALELDPGYLSRLHFTVGMILFKQEIYEEAILHFKNYTTAPKTNPARLKVAQDHIEKGKFRATAMQNPVSFRPQKLSVSINTEMSEFLPSLTAENVMVFSRKVGNQEDLYYSIQLNGKWQEAMPISNLNTSENEAAHSISADGKWLAFTICNRKESIGSCDLFISEWNGNAWSIPKNMGPSINTTGWEAQPALSADGNQLIFASNREGGYGDYDLWISFRSKGKWSSPKNLGNKINTAGKDETPFLHADGQTLYFSSDGHFGMGDRDLFISRKGPDGAWQAPINLGYPINTKNREGALSVSLDGQTAYYASDRSTNNLAPNLDIFAFELPDNLKPNPVTYLKVSLFDQASKISLSGNVSIIELVSKKQITNMPVYKLGSPIICLPTGEKYAFHVKVDDYQLYSEHFDLSIAKDKYEPYLLSIGLQKITTSAAKPIVLNNIFFETGSASLLNTSYSELDLLKTFLFDHADLRIEIRGHTDNTGNDVFNQTLSNDRARAVYEYLVNQGISRSRLTFHGYGASMPVDNNNTEEGRQKNRRTEFIIINE